jgi:hypothetical protein
MFSLALPAAVTTIVTRGHGQSMTIIAITLWITGFLCLLNIVLTILFRKKRSGEILSYCIACAIELAVFAFVLALHLGMISKVPYPLPPGLPFDRAEIGATIAIAIGLFPAAYWHRSPVSQLPARIAQDAQVMKDRNGGVRIKTPGEWIN